MSFKDQFFPRHSRFLPGQRAINIGLRTVHLVGLVVLGVSILTMEGQDLRPGAAITVLLSGLGLMGLYIFSNGAWLFQICGQVVFLKLLLVGAMALWPGTAVVLFFAVLALSTVVAHAPASVRHYSIFHGRRLDHLS
ncbi:MAG: hypothetical protein CL389_07975 [Acidiferrobacteraceae bacterium]|nr:hypothetical protein [Acidiferrobacteraceae bacterium]MDP6791575.1 hypothetical protein [Arenicellales bacterium]MDP6918009.1 hypothetical protein [Arenicellales bacterium]